MSKTSTCIFSSSVSSNLTSWLYFIHFVWGASFQATFFFNEYTSIKHSCRSNAEWIIAESQTTYYVISRHTTLYRVSPAPPVVCIHEYNISSACRCSTSLKVVSCVLIQTSSIDTAELLCMLQSIMSIDLNDFPSNVNNIDTVLLTSKEIL